MSLDETVPVEFYHGAKTDLPQYFESFVLNEATELSRGLREGDELLLINTLRGLTKDLPKDNSFKELGVLLARRKNGGLFLTIVKGEMEEIAPKKAEQLLDELVQEMPLDMEQFMFIHSHPCDQGPLGPTIPREDEVGFSPADKNFLTSVGNRLKVFGDLAKSYSFLVTANSNQVVVMEGNNLGRAHGWDLATLEEIHGPKQDSYRFPGKTYKYENFTR